MGRIYARLIGDPEQHKVNEDMLRRAIEQFQKVTEQDPKDMESWLMLGRLERVNHNSVEAEKAFKKVLDQDASNEEALTGPGDGLFRSRRHQERHRNAAPGNKQESQSANAVRAGQLLRTNARLLRAPPDAWRQALQMDPENSRIKRALAQDVLLTDHFDEALKLYNEIAAADPRDMQVQLRLCEIYRQKGDFAKARAAFNKAHEMDQESLEVRYEEVNLLEAEGKSR